MNILITNIGRRNYLVDYIKDISEFDGKVYVSDCSDTAAGLYGNNDGYFLLPKPVDDPQNYLDELMKLCREKNIGLIIPIIDPEIFILSKYKDTFLHDGVTVAVSDARVLDVCYNKILMNKFLNSIGYDIPKTYTDKDFFFRDLNNGLLDYPVYVKPIYGSGSENTYVATGSKDINVYFNEKMLIQEFIQGEEYGIDVLNDFNCKPVRCVVKKKLGMRSGETDKSVIVINKDLSDYAINMAQQLGHIGNLDCDIIVDGKKKYFIDLNPRFGGGYPATHASGENYLKLLIQMVSGENIMPKFNDYKKDILVMKSISIYTREIE